MTNIAMIALAGLIPAAHAAEAMLWRTEVPAGRGAPQAPAAPVLQQADGEPMLDRQESSRTRLDLSAFESDWVERREAGERGLKTMKFTKARRVTGLAVVQPPPPAPAAAEDEDAAAAAAAPGAAPSAARKARAKGRAVAGRGSSRSAGQLGAPAGTPVASPAATVAILAGAITASAAQGAAGPSALAQGAASRLPPPNPATGGVSIMNGALVIQGTPSTTGPNVPVGTELLDGAGGKHVLVGWDGDKKYGERHHWKHTHQSGVVTEYYSSPLVFDLNGDGVRMSRKSRKLDADADRKQDDVNDVSPSDGLLVLDTDHDGVYGEGGFELLGTGTDLDGDGKADGYKDGFAALKALVLLAEGRGLVARGTAAAGKLGWSELLALQGGWGLRMKVGGMKAKAVPVHDAGVLAIALPTGKCVLVKDFDGQGNDTQRCEGAVFQKKDGTLGAYEDVWFAL